MAANNSRIVNRVRDARIAAKRAAKPSTAAILTVDGVDHLFTAGQRERFYRRHPVAARKDGHA